MNVDRPGDASFDDCEQVLTRVYEFLDNEIDAASGDAIRHRPDPVQEVHRGDVTRGFGARGRAVGRSGT